MGSKTHKKLIVYPQKTYSYPQKSCSLVFPDGVEREHPFRLSGEPKHLTACRTKSNLFIKF